MWRHGTWGHGLPVNLAMLGLWLDLRILEVFSNLVCSMIVMFIQWSSSGYFLGLILKTAQHLKNACVLHRGTLIIKQRMMYGERKKKKKRSEEQLERDRERKAGKKMERWFSFKHVLTIIAVKQNFWGYLIFSFILWNSASSHGKVTELCQVPKAKILRCSPGLWVLMLEILGVHSEIFSH